MEQFMIYQYPASTIYSTSTAPDQKDYLQMTNVIKSSLQNRFKLNKLNTREKKEKITKMLLKFYDVFSWNGEFGRTNFIEHKI